MQKYIEKAGVLIEALPYIQSFRNKTVVIKFGGSVMKDQASLESILRDVVFMECVGINPVVIHGGGPRISEKMQEQGIKPRFADGLRITDEKTIHIVEKTLMGINEDLVDVIRTGGGRAKGMSGRTESMILVAKHPPVETRRIAVRLKGWMWVMWVMSRWLIFSRSVKSFRITRSLSLHLSASI